MRRLQHVDTEGILLERILRRLKFPDFIWLCWKECPYPSLPSSNEKVKGSSSAAPGSTLETLWQPGSQLPVCLEELQVDGCQQLKSIQDLAQLTKLERLDVSKCTELEELPSMKTLVSLEELCASGCVKLKSIRGLAHATKLKEFRLSECTELQELPNMKTLVSLEVFYAIGCMKLKSIQDLAQLTKLQRLDVSRRTELEELPSMETLVSLEVKMVKC